MSDNADALSKTAEAKLRQARFRRRPRLCLGAPRPLGWLGFLLWTALALPAHADLSLETETARLLPAGTVQLSSAVEAQYSSSGEEVALPTSIEVGLHRRLELLVEPVLLTYISPKDPGDSLGVGDLETTLSFLAFDEGKWLPALAAAAEVKFPTARDSTIGTGKFDEAFYLIASKRFGDLDLHANLSYTIVGQPSGANLKNVYGYSLAGEYRLTSQFDLIAELLGDTGSSTGGNSEAEGVLSPEASGRSLSGTFGGRYHVTSNFNLFLTGTYDNQNATLVRAGLTWGFKPTFAP